MSTCLLTCNLLANADFKLGL